MSKVLVAYFSASGVTESCAKEIARAVNGDLYKIEPKARYTAADLDWTNRKSRSSVEMKDPNSRPEIKGSTDISAYDKIFIGFPIWWYVEPRIIDTFLESYDFSGKTIVPFATSGGSGISGAEKSMKEHCPAANFLPGRLVNSGASDWAKSVK